MAGGEERDKSVRTDKESEGQAKEEKTVDVPVQTKRTLERSTGMSRLKRKVEPGSALIRESERTSARETD